MRSFPAMTDMKRDTADISSEAQSLVMPNVSDLPDYDYGLNLSFSDETLKKLDLDDDVSVGDFIHIHGLAQVTSLSQRPGTNKPDRVCMVLTHLACEDEDEETEDEAA